MSSDPFSELDKRRAALIAGGGPDKVARQHALGKLTARERLGLLFDPNSFVEFGLWVKHRCRELEGRELPGDGVVTGKGEVAGRAVMAFSQDFTVGGGAVGALHAAKIVECMATALKCGVPVVGFNDGGGARIQEGVESLSGYGRIFFHNTLLSGVVPQISIVAGSCAGGAAYSPALTDFIVMVERTATMFIAGPDVLWLAIVRQFEPLLLVPIGFGALIANLPLGGLMAPPHGEEVGGLFYYVSYGLRLEIFPPLIFLGLGALTDFGPLLANPKTLILGGAAQFGVFGAFIGAYLLGFSPRESASIGIIGGADGPTSIYLSIKLAPHLLGPIAVSAYSYMALVPLIQPPIMRLLTTREERAIRMTAPADVSRSVRVAFPIVVTIVGSLLVPPATTLIGLLMFGNLLRECGVTERLSRSAQNELINLVTLLLGLSVGVTMSGETFLHAQTLKILALGSVAFVLSTAGGVLLGKLLSRMPGSPVNPLIGAAGVSAVPMAARVAHVVGQEADPNNYLLMHAMGPNVAGVIGTAIAAGALLSFLG